MKWYTISQNNSGGFFIEDETVGIFVSVEASSEEEGDMPTYYGEPLSTLKGYGRGDSVVLHYANGDVIATQAGSEAE